MDVRITYSNQYRAEERGLPPRGTLETVASLEDLLALQERYGSPLILHPADYEPCWVDFDLDPETDEFLDHAGWKGSRWVEVYNGYRE